MPDDLLEPEGAAAEFASVLDALPAGGRVLDCAAGTGQLAVGLALRGYDVVATDASPSMVERARELARQHRAEVRAEAVTWDGLARLDLESFDAVFCVGNSLVHAAGEHGRRSALAGMRAQLRAGGLLAVTSRNWEVVRAWGSGLQMPGRLVVRRGIPGLPVYSWMISKRWEQPHHVDVGVALLREAGLITHTARLTFWPFTHEQLRGDLEACGFALAHSTYTPEAQRYLVTATAT